MSVEVQIAGEEQAGCDFQEGCDGLAVKKEGDKKSQTDQYLQDVEVQVALADTDKEEEVTLAYLGFGKLVAYHCTVEYYYLKEALRKNREAGKIGIKVLRKC